MTLHEALNTEIKKDKKSDKLKWIKKTYDLYVNTIVIEVNYKDLEFNMLKLPLHEIIENYNNVVNAINM